MNIVFAPNNPKKMEKTNRKQTFDWKPIIQLIGILIKFLFKVQKDYRKKSQTALDSKE